MKRIDQGGAGRRHRRPLLGCLHQRGPSATKLLFLVAAMLAGLCSGLQAAGLQQIQTLIDTTDPSGVNAVVVSADSRFVYAAVRDEGIVRAFQRNTATGALTIIDGRVLSGASGIAISPDGSHLYATSATLDEVAVFPRDPVTGRLSAIQSFALDNQSGVDGLAGARGIVASADGKNVYVAGEADNAVAMFRVMASGDLGYFNLLRDSTGTTDGLAGARSLAITADGQFVYVAGANDDAIAVLSRNTGDGLLTFSRVVHDDATLGLGGASAVALSPDNKHLYVAGAVDGAVTVFSGADSSSLSLVEVQQNGVAGVAGLGGASSVAVSADGSHVYAGGEQDSAVVAFSRDASTGRLTYLQTIRESDRQGAAETLVSGLGNLRSLAVSNDGADVYSGSGLTENAVATFSRDPATGTLTFAGVRFGGGPDNLDGLAGASAIIVSPDGQSVYTASGGDEAIDLFQRDSGGLLHFSEVRRDGLPIDLVVTPDGKHVYASMLPSAPIADHRIVELARGGTGGLSVLGTLTPGQGGLSATFAPEMMAISPDGAHLYAASDDDQLVVFGRDSMSGLLTLVEAQVNGAGGVSGLSAPKPVIVSPDGLNVYVGSQGENALAVFRRNSGDGALAFVEVQRDGVAGVDGLQGPEALAMSPDGVHLYVAASGDNAVSVFRRDAVNGALIFVEARRQLQMSAPVDLAVGADGAHVYVVASDSLVVFARNAATGSLTFVEAQQNGVNGVEGLASAASVAVAPNGPHVYTAASLDDAVSVFRVVRCGDGFTDGTEQCDDGNLTPNDGCDPNCRPTGCGNGFVNPGEVCDDGNGVNGDGCDDGPGGNCTPTACGNGVQTAGEACDDGNTNNNDSCIITNPGGPVGPQNCAAARCGDNFKCSAAGCVSGPGGGHEACDDGNSTSGDGCDANCSVTGCGNGIKTVGEACDDGNTNNNDSCIITNPGGPPGPRNCAAAACGDGFICSAASCTSGGNGGKETCDTGNGVNGDGCDDGPGGNCTVTACGNGVKTAGEACDDGNTDNTDTCIISDKNGPPGPRNCVNAACGDGFTCTAAGCTTGPAGGAEQCDSGDLTDPSDNCSAHCGIECGNGVIDGECVAGRRGAACQSDPDCDTTSGAGDGRCRVEECDAGSRACDPAAILRCSAQCTAARCGNGIKECDEQCDLGDILNNTAGSSCGPTCKNQKGSSCRERLAAWTSPDPDHPGRHALRCRDGDACDLDDKPGQCTFEVSMCLGLQVPSDAQSSRAKCNPVAVKSIDLPRLSMDRCWNADAAHALTKELERLPGAVATVPGRCLAGHRGKNCTVDRDCDSFLGSGDGACSDGNGVEFDSLPLGTDATCTSKVKIKVPAGRQLHLRSRVRGHLSGAVGGESRMWRDTDTFRLVCRAAAGASRSAPELTCDTPTPTETGTPTLTPTVTPTPSGTVTVRLG